MPDFEKNESVPLMTNQLAGYGVLFQAANGMPIKWGRHQAVKRLCCFIGFVDCFLVCT